MKAGKKIIFALALCLILNLFPLTAAAAPGDTDTEKAGSVFTTDVEAVNKEAAVTVSMAEKEGVSSGQLVLWYDHTVMELDESNSFAVWKLEDINTSYDTKGNETGVSFAFADTSQVDEGQDVLQLNFLVKEPVEGMKITVRTEVKSLYRGTVGDNSIPEQEATGTVQITTDPNPGPGTDPNPGPGTGTNPGSEGSRPAGSGTARTGDDFNVNLWFGMMMFAVFSAGILERYAKEYKGLGVRAKR